MKSILIDTNVYSAFKADIDEVLEVFRAVEHIGVNSTVLGELYSGFKLGMKEEKNRVELNQFLDSPRVHFYSINETTAEIYAGIFKSLRKNGTPIPTNDMWIAATAMQHGLALYSLDKHFDSIPGILRR